MLGQDYFKNRLGDIYQYSRIPYQSGEGTSDQNRKYFWELCIDISGNIIFVLHPRGGLEPLENPPKMQGFSGISLDEKWEIECSDLHFLAAEIEISQKSHLFYLPSSVSLKQKTKKDQHPNIAKAYFSNSLFSSVDYPNGFIVNIDDKELCFQMLDNYKQIVEFIAIGRIDHAILSQVSIPINTDEDIHSIVEEAKSISWFFSLLSLNTNCIPIIEYLSANEIVQFYIENNSKDNLNTNCFIVDNLKIDRGIPKAFNECYENYKRLQKDININKFIAFLVEINQQKYIELKLAVMIMAYEYFLTKYLIQNQLITPDQAKMNIKAKLTKLNSQLKFIPSSMMNDTLRASVRNQLFHQGEISLMTTHDKIDKFKKYYDLLVKIILKILGYTGKYRSVETGHPTEIGYNKPN